MAEKATAGKRASKKNGAAGHNSGKVPDEVKARHLQAVIEHQAVVEKASKPLKAAKGALSAALALAKDDGCDIDALREAIKQDKLDHLDVVSKYVETGVYLRLLKSPLALQMSLFRETDLPPVVTAAASGKKAGKAGQSIDLNPHLPGSAEHVEYANGWHAGQREVRESTLG